MKPVNWLTSALTALAIAASPAALAQQGETESPAAEMQNIVLGDVVLGNPDAPITIIEYASITCPHCAHFHDDVMPVIEERIELGQVKFIFRDFPTPPVNVAMAGFAMARCAGEDQYYPVLDTLFSRQEEMIETIRDGSIGAWLTDVGIAHGLSQDEFDACLGNGTLFEAMVGIIEDGQAMGVNSTPTVFLNGERLGADAQSPSSMAALIDAALADAS